MRFLSRGVVLVVAIISLAALVGVSLQPAGHGPQGRRQLGAAVSAYSDSVVAVIAPLPDEVSNGTWTTLYGNASHDSSGILMNWTWAIVNKENTTYVYYSVWPFKFKDLGLYTITLTVRDDHGNWSQAFTAVYAVVDSNGNGLPDWWEMKYFHNLNQTASGSYAHDGYSNLQHYANGWDPTVKHSHPGLVEMLAQNWMYLAAIAAAVVVALIMLLPRMKKKQDAVVKKKIEAAIEIEKALESEK